MGKKIFVSYSHQQGEWVWKRLAPCLEAGGAGVFIDKERFQAGKGVVGQMDAWQDGADGSVLVLSREYLNSPYCRHEMDRAVARDPDFQRGCVIPVLRVPCLLPEAIKRPNPLYVDLTNDADPTQWDLVLAPPSSGGRRKRQVAPASLTDGQMASAAWMTPKRATRSPAHPSCTAAA